MRCMVHSDRDAGGSCSHCNKDYCAECLVPLNGGKFCKACVADLAKREGHGEGPRYRYRVVPHVRGKKAFSKFWLFVLSLLPGAGYMYLGLIKRGGFVMSIFFLAIYLISAVRINVIGFLIPIIFCTSFFDSFRILKLIRMGVDVQDDIDDVKGFVMKNKFIALGVAAALMLIEFFSFSHMMRGGRILLSGGGGGLLPLLLLGLGVYFLFFRGRRGAGRKSRDDDDSPKQ